MLQEFYRAQEFAFKNDFKIVVFYATKHICTIASHTQISVTHAHTFTVI